MRISTKTVFDIKTGKILVRGSYDYFGPIEYLKASSAEDTISSEQASFYQTLTSSYAQQFAGQSAILSALTSEFTPILQAGPNQFGFSPQETANLRTSASDTNATQFKNAEVALNNQNAQAGGGNTLLPSGTNAQLQAGLDTAAATNETNTQNQITAAGYNQGRQNFSQAVSALSGTAQIYNPQSYATSANSAGTSAFNSAYTIQQQNTGWEASLGGILGGAAGAVLGGPIGASIGSSPGSAAGGGYNPQLDESE